MKIKFKKRFKSIVETSKFICENLRTADNQSMSATFIKSKSRNGKKTYYNLTGWYEPEPKEQKQ